MHRHDLDLIAALADGSLEDETEARRRIETCPECRAEYQAQRSVLAALATVEPVAMTDHERAALHRDVWTELRSAPQVAEKASPWWWRWSYAAAGLLVVVGLVGVLTQMNGGGDEAAETLTEASSGLDGEGAVSQLRAAETTVPVLEEAAPAADAGSDAIEAGAPPGLLETLESLRTASEAYSTAGPEPANQECLEQAGVEDHVAVRLIPYGDEVYIAAVPEGEPEDTEDVTFVNSATCEVVTAEE